MNFELRTKKSKENLIFQLLYPTYKHKTEIIDIKMKIDLEALLKVLDLFKLKNNLTRILST